jgi:hypothetical protein
LTPAAVSSQELTYHPPTISPPRQACLPRGRAATCAPTSPWAWGTRTWRGQGRGWRGGAKVWGAQGFKPTPQGLAQNPRSDLHPQTPQTNTTNTSGTLNYDVLQLQATSQSTMVRSKRPSPKLGTLGLSATCWDEVWTCESPLALVPKPPNHAHTSATTSPTSPQGVSQVQGSWERGHPSTLSPQQPAAQQQSHTMSPHPNTDSHELWRQLPSHHTMPHPPRESQPL